jgi:hypothetical protein
VAIYARLSSLDQQPENQLLELRRYATARGWQVVAEHVDHGVSGAKERRPALDALKADAKRRRIACVSYPDQCVIGTGNTPEWRALRQHVRGIGCRGRPPAALRSEIGPRRSAIAPPGHGLATPPPASGEAPRLLQACGFFGNISGCR